MVSHQAYFDALASTEEDSPAWAPTLAGLAVLGLVDAAREDPSVIDTDWTGVRAVVESVTALREGTPLRRPLMKVVDNLRDHPNWSAITTSLFAYGRALDLEGSWKLATDVFGTVAEIARQERQPELAIEATTALGGAARRSGDWDRSAEGYAEAAHLANALGDKASGLTVRVGTANTQIARGNLPGAQEILDEVIAEATKSQLDRVMAIAFHASATVAHLKGRYAEAGRLAYRALENTTNPSAKDEVLADIAAAFVALGMHTTARDAYMIISLTSQHQWVRWQSEVNLMELAALDGMEDAFDSYARNLKNAALDPRLRAYFLLFYGQGCIRFGREEEGRRIIAEAYDFASSKKIHQVAFDAGRAVTIAMKQEARGPDAGVPSSEPVPANVREVALAIARLREGAQSSPAAGDWA